MTDLLFAPGSYDTPLTIGVIADTHIWARSSRKLPAEVLDLFRRSAIGLLLHAGDINERSVLDELSLVAPVVAVQGNNDDADLQALLPLKLQIAVGAFTIGLVHGHDGKSAKEVAWRAFPAETTCVVYGHSHRPSIELRDRTLFFNPGSPSDRRWNPHFGIGFLRCTSSGIDPHLVLFARPTDLVNVTMPWITSGS